MPGPVVQLRLASRADLLRSWPGGKVLSDRRDPAGRRLQYIALNEGGYLFHARGWGVFHISADGLAVRCAPVRMAGWRWQRYLVGQLLPFVSLLRGYEVFHASVLTKGPHTVAFVGASGAGKSSLATALLLRDWELVADDVLVVAVDDAGGIVAHSAPSLTSLRHDAASRLTPDELQRLGRIVGRDDEALRLLTPTTGATHPLTHLYVLERAEQGPPVEPMQPVDPKVLLASTFNFLVQEPARLLRQLDVCHRIASTVAVGRALVTGEHGPSELAEHIERDMSRAAAAPNIATFTAR